MGGKSPGSCYVSVQLSHEEKDVLDKAAKDAGMNRNKFIRAFIAMLAARKQK